MLSVMFANTCLSYNFSLLVLSRISTNLSLCVSPVTALTFFNWIQRCNSAGRQHTLNPLRSQHIWSFSTKITAATYFTWCRRNFCCPTASSAVIFNYVLSCSIHLTSWNLQLSINLTNIILYLLLFKISSSIKKIWKFNQCPWENKNT